MLDNTHALPGENRLVDLKSGGVDGGDADVGRNLVSNYPVRERENWIECSKIVLKILYLLTDSGTK